MGDTHCGHRVGLTPPGWQLQPLDDPDEKESVMYKRSKWLRIQQETWKLFSSRVTRSGPFDLVIGMGDMIDGTGFRSGGTELITTDRQVQCDIAIRVLRQTKCKNFCLVHGTPYHTGDVEDMEDQIAAHFDQLPGYRCEIGDHEWPEINGVVFDVKHSVGSSTVPHGRATAVAKENLWNIIWAEHKEQPRADILVRGHVHYYGHQDYMVNGRAKHLATIPALQAMGTKFGARKCSGHIDWGFVVVEIGPKGEISWQPNVLPIDAQRAQTSQW